VVLDVAGRQLLRRLALELGEQVRGDLAQRVDQHVEAAAVRHPHHDLLHARRAGALDQPVEHRRHRVAALAREALLPDVLGVQVALERLGRGQPLEDVAPLLGRERAARARRLDALLHVALDRRVRDVHVLEADRARVGLAQRRVDVAQPHARLAALERADVELGVEVGVGEPVGAEVEVGDVGRLLALERVEVGVEEPERAVLADHAQHQHLLRHRGLVDHRGADSSTLPELDERLHHRRVRDVRRVAAQLGEVAGPLAGHRFGVREPGLVELLDERRVRAEQARARFPFLHDAHGLNPVGRPSPEMGTRRAFS
jgi:hypothetical protein